MSNRDTLACFFSKHLILELSSMCTLLAWRWELDATKNTTQGRDTTERCQDLEHSVDEDGESTEDHLGEIDVISVSR